MRMGAVLAGCVNCATYIHDKYNDRRWTDTDPQFVDMGNFSRNDRPPDNRSAHACVIDKNESEMRRIFREDPSLGNQVNSAGETALHLACKLGYRHMVEVLLDCGCAVGICTTIGTPVHCVIKATHTGYLSDEAGSQLIETLDSKGCDIHHATDSGKKSALFYAAELGALRCMRSLIHLGAPLNCQDYNGFTPLYMATIRGDLAAVCLLLQQCPRINVNLPDDMGRTPLLASLITITNNFRYEGQVLNQIGHADFSSQKCFVWSSRYSHVAVVEALLRAGADPNVLDNHHRTALVIAFVMLELDMLHKDGGCPISCNGRSTQCKVGPGMESMYAPLVRLLVLSGARFPGGWVKNYSESPGWISQLYAETEEARQQELVQRPSRLVHLCRLSVRAHLAMVGRLHQVQQVPLPPNLRGYLQVRYI